jgi:hypothetical protein
LLRAESIHLQISGVRDKSIVAGGILSIRTTVDTQALSQHPDLCCQTEKQKIL